MSGARIHPRHWASVVALLFTFGLPAADAQLAAELNGLNGLCTAAIRSGDTEEALRTCRRVSFDIERLAPGSQAYITSLTNIGEIKWQVANYVDADAFYGDALKAVEAISGRNTPASLPLLGKIVETKIKRGKFIDAEAVLRRAIAIQRKGAAPNDPALAALRLRQADLQALSHQYPEAERGYLDVITVFAAGGAASDAMLRTGLQHYAELLEREQKFARAEAQYLRLLALVEKKPSDTSLSPAAVLDRLGYLAEQLDRQADAMSYYQRELALLRALSGKPDDKADDIGNLEAKLSSLKLSLSQSLSLPAAGSAGRP